MSYRSGIDTILSHLQLLPRIGTLEWRDNGATFSCLTYTRRSFVQRTNWPPTKSFQQALKSWKQLSRIVDATIYIGLITHFLESGIYNKLERLSIRLSSHERLEDLVHCIHNAPQLKYLLLEDAPMKLADLEQ